MPIDCHSDANPASPFQINQSRANPSEICQSIIDHSNVDHLSMANSPNSDLYAIPPKKHQSRNSLSIHHQSRIPSHPYCCQSIVNKKIGLNYQMPPRHITNKQNWIGSASAQVKPILYQSEDNCASNKRTSALRGQATSLDGGRLHTTKASLQYS